MTANNNAEDDNYYDIVIVGAGGAGMCLLFALAKADVLSAYTILVIDAEEKTQHDRTWCFPAGPEEQIFRSLGGLCTKKWDQVNFQGRTQTLQHPYCCIRSADFYQEVHRLIAPAQRVHRKKETVSGLLNKGDHTLINTNKGVYWAKLVFDSRPIELPPHAIKQSFLGFFIRTHRPINDQALVLMDFNVPQNGQTRFLYQLPFDPHHVLVELTCLGKTILDPAEARPFLLDWIKQHYGDAEILETEIGVIPMTQHFENKQATYPLTQSIIPIGTPAGAVRPSTGYAFKTMFNHAFRIVQALKFHHPLPAIVRKPRTRFYDQLLLHILDKHPHWGKPIFNQLLSKVPCAKVLAFMDEDTSLLEEIPLLLSLPVYPFINAFTELYLLNNEAPLVTESYPSA